MHLGLVPAEGQRDEGGVVKRVESRYEHDTKLPNI